MKKTLRCLLIMVLCVLMLVQAALADDLHITNASQSGSTITLYETATNSQNSVLAQQYRASDYTLMIGDADFDAVDAHQYDGKIHYVVCVDISASIGGKYAQPGTDEKATMKDSIRAFISGLNGNEVMTLIAFGDRVTVLAEASSDKNALMTAVDRLTFVDMTTALNEVVYTGIDKALDHVRNYPNSAVIVLTDGTDEPNANGNDVYSNESILEKARISHVPVYTLVFQHTENDDISTMSQLSILSGGVVQSVPANAFKTRLTNVQGITRSTAVVTFELNNEIGRAQRRLDEELQGSLYNGSSHIYSAPYSFALDWSRVPTPSPTPSPSPTPKPSPTPDVVVEASFAPLTEDSTEVSVKTEPNARVIILDDVGNDSSSAPLSEGYAGGDGQFVWDAAAANHIFKLGERIRVDITDPTGNNQRSEISVGASSREAITATVMGGDTGSTSATMVTETLTVIGNAQANQRLIVTWNDTDTSVPSVEVPVNVDSNKNYKITIPYTEAAASFEGGRHQATGYITVRYADGYGVSKGAQTAPFVWDIKTDQTVDYQVMPVTEDSAEVRVVTEPGAWVVVYDDPKNDPSNRPLDQGEAGQDGVYVYNAAAAGHFFKVDDRIRIAVTDTAENSDRTEVVVGASSREPITLNIADSASGAVGSVVAQELNIIGSAEANQRVIITWTHTDPTVPSVDFEADVDENKSYKYTIPYTAVPDSFEGGRQQAIGYLTVRYADGYGASRSTRTAPFTWDIKTDKAVEYQINPITEDSSEIRITTEPQARVVIYDDPRNDPTNTPLIEGEANRSGVFVYDAAVANHFFRVDERIRIDITDQAGNSERVDETVGASSREQITVNIPGAASSGALVAQELSVIGSAEASQRLTITWTDTDTTLPSVDFPVDVDENKSYKYTIPYTAVADSFADGRQQATGYLTIRYADGYGASRAVRTPLIVWDIKTDKTVEYRINPITEDSSEIRINTEPQAHVIIYDDPENDPTNTPLVEGDANASGLFVWDAAAEGHFFKVDEKIRIDVTDQSGNNERVEQTVGASSRDQITLSVMGGSNDAASGSNVIVTEELSLMGSAQANQQLIVTWIDADSTVPSVDFPVTVDENKTFKLAIPYDSVPESFAGGRHQARGYISVRYADGYGASRAANSEVFMWDKKIDQAVTVMEFSEPVTEDSDSVLVKTEPGASVAVTANGEALTVVTADDSGLAAAPVRDFLPVDSKVEAVITDLSDNTATISTTVAQSSRRQITVTIAGLNGTTLTGSEMVVSGVAEPNQDLIVEWIGRDNTVGGRQTTQSTAIGTYEVAMTNWGSQFAQGGVIQTRYADNRAASRAGTSDQGLISWLTPSPEPTAPPTPVPTAVPVEETVAPSVEPAGPVETIPPTEPPAETEAPDEGTGEDETGEGEEAAAGVAGILSRFFGENYTGNWKFWVMVGLIALILLLILFLILRAIRKARERDKNIVQIDGETDQNTARESQGEIGTVRKARKNGSDQQGAASTERMPGQPGQPGSDGSTSRVVGGVPFAPGAQPKAGAPTGTVNVHAAGTPAPTGTISIHNAGEPAQQAGGPAGAQPKPGAQPKAGAPKAGSGTVRMAVDRKPEVTGTGTVRMAVKPKGIELTIDEKREADGFSQTRKVNLAKELIVGRLDSCDVTIHDETVSSRHAIIALDAGKIYLTDNNSSNGTTINDGDKLKAGERVPLESGATVTMGRTKLTITYKLGQGDAK